MSELERALDEFIQAMMQQAQQMADQQAQMPPDPNAIQIERQDLQQMLDAIREMVRELGFLQSSFTPVHMPHSHCHTLMETELFGPLSQNELSERLRLDKSSTSRIVAELVRQGLLSTADDPGDKRRRLAGRDRRRRRNSRRRIVVAKPWNSEPARLSGDDAWILQGRTGRSSKASWLAETGGVPDTIPTPTEFPKCWSRARRRGWASSTARARSRRVGPSAEPTRTS